MTLTLRIEDNSETAKQLELIKEYFSCKTNTDAITRAIAYLSNYEERKRTKDELHDKIDALNTEISQYKTIFRVFTGSIERMKELTLTE
jgi:hypothetical protein